MSSTTSTPLPSVRVFTSAANFSLSFLSESAFALTFDVSSFQFVCVVNTTVEMPRNRMAKAMITITRILPTNVMVAP